ncbi:hypothetical protein [Bradyrhizobium tunisiense]|uniref:hypothetical protein n=1 Tax=Bradyrhizobium tunisiense TaxID=3278709 RepID=UPI0035E20163
MTLSVSTEDYFRLRKSSEGLKEESPRFEGMPWALTRETNDGWTMKVYRVDGDVEVCVIAPDGTSKSFA